MESSKVKEKEEREEERKKEEREERRRSEKEERGELTHSLAHRRSLTKEARRGKKGEGKEPNQLPLSVFSLFCFSFSFASFSLTSVLF